MTDFNALRLKHSGDPEEMQRILQMECRHRCARKLDETLLCEDFIFPSKALAEMATSDAAARFHASLIEPGENVLDMTFGLGIDTFHFARKGAKVTAVEIDPHSAETGRRNVESLGLDNIEIITADSMKWLAESDNRTFSTIFIDPARRDSTGRHFSLADSLPDITTNLQLLRSRCHRIIVKCSPMADLTAVARELGGDVDFITVGTTRECKELLAITPGSGRMAAYTVDHGLYELSGTPDAPCALPTEGDYLYEPFPALMKLRRATISAPALTKIAPETRIYSSPQLIAGFPGEAFRIIRVVEFNKRTVRRIAEEFPRLNVTTRNFPLSAPELLKRLGVAEGGNFRAFGVTDSKQKKHLIITTNESEQISADICPVIPEHPAD